MNSKVSAKKISFCNEPYYPPGYCGYNPQFHFRFGETFGKTTYRLLTDSQVAKSKRPVLTEIFPSEGKDIDRKQPANEWMRLRKESWGDKKLGEQMVPGYTGYIPKKEIYFGSRYAESCKKASDDFAGDMRRNREKRTELRPKPPMRALKAEPEPYISLNQPQHSVSPYFMRTDDPGKTFMSGYTGFIPQSRSKFALVYPDLTQQALVDFTAKQQRMKRLENKAVVVKRPMRRSSSPQEIYTNDGLLPSYTGYLPSHKFRFGSTFGSSSRYFHQAVNKHLQETKT